jgi:H+-translocating NAD(P) transhydrogenase subunit alpha
MAVTNAISSVIIVGALLAAAAHGAAGEPITKNIWISKGAGAVAAAFAAVNIFGGFLVTQRMLAMYKKKDKAPQKAGQQGGHA